MVLRTIFTVLLTLGIGSVMFAAPPKLTPSERFARTPAGKKQAKEKESYQAELRKNVSSVFMGSQTRSSVVVTKRNLTGGATGYGTDKSTESQYRYTFKPKVYDMTKVRGEFAERANVKVVATENPNVLDVYGEDLYISGWEAMIATNGKWGSWPDRTSDAGPITAQAVKDE